MSSPSTPASYPPSPPAASRPAASASATGPDGSGRHPVVMAHLVLGLAFLGVVGVWALVQTDAVSGGDVRWLLPLPWLVGGAVGLAMIAVRSVRRAAGASDDPSADPETEPETDPENEPETDPENVTDAQEIR